MAAETPSHLPVFGFFKPSAIAVSVFSALAQSIPATSAVPAPPSAVGRIGSKMGR